MNRTIRLGLRNQRKRRPLFKETDAMPGAVTNTGEQLNATGKTQASKSTRINADSKDLQRLI
jgi:hypothetical protein